MSRDPEYEAERREFLQNTQVLYEQWKQWLEDAARSKGIEIGRKQTLLKVYEVRFGAVPAEIRAVLEAIHDPTTLDDWTVLLGTRTEEEVRAVLLERLE
jgi:hypothetical protein